MKSMYFSSVAHELRTPLNAIIPIIRMILTNFRQSIDDRVENYLKIVLNSSLHLENVIEDALDMSRIENGKFEIINELFDIRETLNEVCEVMEFQVKQKKLRLQVNIDDNIPAKVRTDKKRFRQIMFNLIGNALKFTFKGAITVKLAFFNGILFTEIQDTGIGIKEHDLNLIFKFFGQIKKSKNINRGGMGLGLTISKAILLQLGGEINVESEYQKGSNFKFKIPISEFEYSEDQVRHVALPPIERDYNRNLIQNLASFDPEFDTDALAFSEEDMQADSDGSLVAHYMSLPVQARRIIVEEIEPVQIQQKLRVLIVDDTAYNIYIMEELLMLVPTVGKIVTAINGE